MNKNFKLQKMIQIKWFMIYSEWFHEQNQPIQIEIVYEFSWTLILTLINGHTIFSEQWQFQSIHLMISYSYVYIYICNIYARSERSYTSMQCRGQLRHEVAKKAIKAAVKQCVHVICYIWVTLRTCLWNGLQNCPRAAQCLPHLTPDSTHQFISRDFKTWSGSEKVGNFRENKMRVRSASCSAATALKETAAKKQPNNQLLWCPFKN